MPIPPDDLDQIAASTTKDEQMPRKWILLQGQEGLGPNGSDENAPKVSEDRRRIAKRIQPVMTKLMPLAQSIRRTIEETLSRERAEIAADAAYVLEQRKNMEAEHQAELTRILNANSETDPTSDGPGT